MIRLFGPCPIFNYNLKYFKTLQQQTQMCMWDTLSVKCKTWNHAFFIVKEIGTEDTERHFDNMLKTNKIDIQYVRGNIGKL